MKVCPTTLIELHQRFTRDKELNNIMMGNYEALVYAYSCNSNVFIYR